ncbi:MAG: D-alanyl-D-alanine carboxypeptidase/D-alanyl-D-alanine-endopeptidase [Acidobacteriota bacterium]
MHRRLDCRAKRWLGVMLCALSWTGPLGLAAQVPLSQQSLRAEVEKVLNQPQFDAGFWGVHIVALKTGEVLFSSSAQKRFIPASNMKLLVAAAALDTWGPEFRFQTEVCLEGRLDPDGKALGNIVLVGTGDPNFEQRIYTPEKLSPPTTLLPESVLSLADQVLAHGVRHLEGDVIADERAFAFEPVSDSWSLGYLQWSYGAKASSIAVNENVFTLQILPGNEVGDPATTQTWPRAGVPAVVNQLVTAKARGPVSLTIKSSLGGGEFRLLGQLPLRHSQLVYQLPVPDPGEFAAQLLKAALEEKGIAVAGQATSRKLDLPEPLELARNRTPIAISCDESLRLAERVSLPLRSTLEIMMKESQNLYAEMLLRKLGWQASGIGSLNSGLDAVNRFLDKAGVERKELSLTDGSGLSRTGQITPRALVQLLQHMNGHPQGPAFLALLPVSGLDGTLKNRMRRSAAQGRVHAKTGSLGLVSTLSGYVVAAHNEKLAFSIMANHHATPSREVSTAMDQICDLMVAYDSQAADEPAN